MSDAFSGTGSSSTPSQTSGSSDKEPETTEYTIKSVNTGLKGDHVRETVEVDGDSFGPGDKVKLTEVAHKSLTAMGVKFES